MKIELQISETYKEEKLIVQAPQETDKIQKSSSSQKIWTKRNNQRKD